MRNKKKIFALVLFILMGFFMFTFANPSDGIDELTTPVDEEEKDTPKPVVNEKPIEVNNPINQVIAVIDTAPIITVNPKEVKILRGTDYDVNIGVTIADDKDTNLKPTISMTSTIDAEAGTYTLTYTVTDSSNNIATTTRTVKVLEPDEDEDEDGYTNQEEYDDDTDFDDVDEYPEYDKSPSITIDENNTYSMEINTTIPTFSATATDVADGDVDVVITHNIDLTKINSYTVVFTATDVLGNKTELTKEFTVVDTKAPIIENLINSSNENWTNSEVVTKWDIVETGSGIKTVEYCYSAECTDWNTMSKSEWYGLTRNAERNNTVYVRTIDNANNISNVIAVIFKIDKTKPMVVVKSDQTILTSGSYYDLRKAVRIQPNDNNSLGKVFVNGIEYAQYYGSSSFKIDWIINKDNSTDTFNVVVEDAAGNKSDNFVINVDRTAPDGVITYSNNNGNQVTNEDVTATLKTTEEILTPSGWDKVNEKEFTKVYSANGKYTIGIEDIYGNKKTLNYEVKRIDKVAPIIDGIVNNGFYEHNLTYDIIKTKNTNVDFSIIEDNFSSVVVDGVLYDYKTASKVISGEGIHTVKAIDKAGNESETITFTIDYPFTITQKLSNELITTGYRIAGGTQNPVINKYYSKSKFSSFACVNDGVSYDCQPVVWKDSKGNIVSEIKEEKTVVSSYDMYYEANETFTAYPMGAIIEYKLSDEFINMGYKIGSSSPNSNMEGFSTTRTYYFNEATKLVSFPYVNSGNGTYVVYNSNGELVSNISDGLTKPISYSHVVTGHEVYTIAPLMYNVVFKDHDGSIISNQRIFTNGSYTAPDMIGKTYTSKYITYVFTGWDKTINNVTSDLTIRANYVATSALANLYELDKNATRPSNGGGLSGSHYKNLGTISLNMTDDVKNAIKSGSTKILTFDLSKVLTHVSNSSLLPVPTNNDENFTKYEFYVLKFESANGFHIDCQEVVDITALENYRSAAISTINDYAYNLGFDTNSGEITGIVNVAGINGLNTKSTIDAAVVTAKGSIDLLFAGIKKTAKDAIQTIINNQAFKNGYDIKVNIIRDTANSNIDNSLTIVAITSIKNQAITDINNLKALSLITFNATITTVAGDGNWKYFAINNIASDVIITKVEYYLLDQSIYTYNGSTYISSFVATDRIGFARKIRVEYTKNGIAYFAKYNVIGSPLFIKGVERYDDTYKAQ